MNPRLLKTADSNKRLLKRITAVALIITVFLVLLMGYFVITEEPTKQVETKETYPVSQQITTSVTITNDTRLYQEGETIENAALYPRDETTPPTVQLTTTAPSEVQPVNITHEIVIKMRATVGGNTYWTDTQTLATNQKTLTDERKLTTQTQFSIDSLAETARKVKDTYGQGKVSAKIQFRTIYTDGAGKQSLTTTFPIRTSEKAFGIGPGSQTQRGLYEVQTTENRPDSFIYSIVQYLTLIFIFITGLLGFAILKADPSRTEVDYILLEYDEWVNTVHNKLQPPNDAMTHHSFDTLINTARSANKPVFYDEETNTFQTTIGDTKHTYSPNTESTSNPTGDDNEP